MGHDGGPSGEELYTIIRKQIGGKWQKVKEKPVQRTEMDDAKEFAELYGMLSPNERQHVKSIIIGIQLAKEAEKEVAMA